MTYPTIFDASVNVFGKSAKLFAGGTRIVIRYIAKGLERETKVIKPGEAHEIGAAGLHLVLVYEVNGRPRGRAQGLADGEYARKYAPTVGAPAGAGVIIWYTSDEDAPPSAMEAIREAFEGFRDGLGGDFRAGAYASGAVCDMLWDAKIIAGRWITQSRDFRGSKEAIAAGRYEMRQLLESRVDILGTTVDGDIASHDINSPDGSKAIGAFTPFGLGPSTAPLPLQPAHGGIAAAIAAELAAVARLFHLGA